MKTSSRQFLLFRGVATFVGVALCAMLLPSAPAQAAVEPPSPLIRPYAFTFGSYFTAVDTDVSADESVQNRNEQLDFESDLDFAKRSELFRLEGQFLIRPRHQLNFGYYELNRSASNIISREIEWRDRVFPVDVRVSGFFDFDVTELSYTYWWVAKEDWVLGVNGGIQKIGVGVGLDLAGEAGGRGVGTDYDTDELVPLFGLEVRRRMTDQLMFRGLGRYITFSDIGDLKRASVTDLSLGFEHQTFENFGIGLAYKLLNFNLDVEKRLVSGEADYQITGVEFFFRLGFNGK